VKGNSAQPRNLSPAKLAAARREAGYRTQWKFAKAVGITRARYNRWESKRPPRRFDYHLMARALELLGKRFEDISDPALAVAAPSAA
jgi:DNA-binding XRE family transcriptional regulator